MHLHILTSFQSLSFVLFQDNLHFKSFQSNSLCLWFTCPMKGDDVMFSKSHLFLFPTFLYFDMRKIILKNPYGLLWHFRARSYQPNLLRECSLCPLVKAGAIPWVQITCLDFSLSVETHRYIHKRTFNFYDYVDCKYAQTSTLLFCRKPLSWDYWGSKSLFNIL